MRELDPIDRASDVEVAADASGRSRTVLLQAYIAAEQSVAFHRLLARRLAFVGVVSIFVGATVLRIRLEALLAIGALLGMIIVWSAIAARRAMTHVDALIADHPATSDSRGTVVLGRRLDTPRSIGPGRPHHGRQERAR